MKIAYILGRFPGLTETFIFREVKELRKNWADLCLIALGRPADEKVLAEARHLMPDIFYILPVNWIKFVEAHLHCMLTRPLAYFSLLIYLLTRRYSNPFFWLQTLWYFALGVYTTKRLSKEQPDHIHAHYAHRPAIIAMVVAKLLQKTYSFTAHAGEIYVDPVILPEKIALAKFVVTCTAYNRDHLTRLIGDSAKGKIECIYHGLDLAAFDPTCRSLDDKVRLLAVGRLEEKKGFPYLIRACQQLKDKGYRFTCHIVGEGSKQKELEALIAELALRDRVFLYGALPHSEVLAEYKRATIFILPCIVAANGDRDGIPNVLLEAMATQVPVISTQVSAIPELVEDGKSGLLVPARDATALAAAIASLIDAPGLRERLGKQGREKVQREFDVQRNVFHLLEVFESRLKA